MSGRIGAGLTGPETAAGDPGATWGDVTVGAAPGGMKEPGPALPAGAMAALAVWFTIGPAGASGAPALYATSAAVVEPDAGKVAGSGPAVGEP